METTELKLMQHVRRLVNHTNELLHKLAAEKVELKESVSQLQKSLDGANAQREESEARLARLQRQRDGPVTSTDVRLDDFAVGGRLYEHEVSPGSSSRPEEHVVWIRACRLPFAIDIVHDLTAES